MCVSSLPALQGTDSAWEYAGWAHTGRHISSPPHAHPPRTPELRRHPLSFTAPCRGGPVVRCPVHGPAEICGSGARPRPRGRCCHPRGAQPEPGRSRGSCLLLSPLKGRSKKRRGLWCKGCWGCARAPGEAARAAAEDRLAPFAGLFPLALRGALR